MEGVGNCACTGRVSGAQVGDGLVGEHDPPAKGVIRPVSFEYGDLSVWIATLDEQGRIQPARTTADHENVHTKRRSIMRERVRCIASNIKETADPESMVAPQVVRR